jgi:hypothetical protein
MMNLPKRVGYYWWRGTNDSLWQIVEVFEQDNQLLVARCGRSWCCPLNERGGKWGFMIPPFPLNIPWLLGKAKKHFNRHPESSSHEQTQTD